MPTSTYAAPCASRGGSRARCPRTRTAAASTPIATAIHSRRQSRARPASPSLRLWPCARAIEAVPRQPELREPERQAHRSREKADAPAVPMRQPTGDQRADEGAQVDPHIENREARIAPAAAFGIEIRDERRDVRFQQADAEDDHDEPAEEQFLRAGHHQHQVAERHQRAAQHHRTLRADQPVRDPAAGQCRHEHGGRVEAVDCRGGLVIQAVAAVADRIDEKQHEQRTHSVEREALPHLGEEKRRERPWVPAQHAGRCIMRRRRARPRRGSSGANCANTMPSSYSRYIGTAMKVCETASGGVKKAATTKIARTM